MSLMKCYYMLQNARVTAFTVAELLRGNQQRKEGGGVKITHLTYIRVTYLHNNQYISLKDNHA